MAQANTISRPFSPRAILWVGVALVTMIAVAAVVWWLPQIGIRLTGILNGNDIEPSSAVSSEADQKQEHDHEHGGHDHSAVLELSAQARRNIGLRTGPVKLQAYDRTLSIPGIVVERPGQSVVNVTAPLTGVVTQLYVTAGEAVSPAQKLFDLRLTHEDVVQAQAELLRTAQELDVIRKEVKRLEVVTRDGAVAGKTLLERKYEEEKQQAVLQAQREALVLHGLNEDQIEQILETRRLLPSIRVFVPELAPHAASAAPVLQIQSLTVEQGQHVNTGDSLAVLTNHAELLIEGRAFEHDATQISHSLEQGWPVSAAIESQGDQPTMVEDLQILYLAGRIDPESRALHFYVSLPNELLRDKEAGGRRYVAWRFKPGQRVQIRVPMEKWQDRIVLPIDAIAQEGAEIYVFRVNGERLVRQPVHVEFRDQFSAVVSNDGSLYPGDEIALNAAHQLLVALKNKSGGGVDPHAGHTH
jgi:membrane fusion protein, heavy metal efflux system